MTRYLVFGATGFIGQHVGARLRSEPDAEVVAAGRSPGSGVDLRLDLAAAGPAEVARALRDVEPDTVVNCAGTTHGDPAALVAGNVVAVAHLVSALAWMRPETRLVHLGSAAEYGRVEPGTSVGEWARPEPVGGYGITKLAATQLIRAAGLDAVVLRVFNLVGPGAPGNSLPGRLVAEMRRAGGEVRVGPLDGHRDFVDVRDVADAVLAATAVRTPTPLVVNIGRGRATPLRELAAAIAAVAGTRQRIAEDAAGSERSAAVSWQQADVRVAAEALGWTATTSLEVSLRDMWEAA